MRGLADVRLLVLVDGRNTSGAEADLDLLDRRTTAHRLPSSASTLLPTLLRLIKRLLLGQDDVILTYNVGILALLIVGVVARLFGTPIVSISARRRSSSRRSTWKALNVVQVGLYGHIGQTREQLLLRALAQALGRNWEQALVKPLRIDLGCGSQIRPGFLGIDARKTRATSIVSDARSVAVANHVADEVYASCLLEHFENPHEVLREIHRILVPDGQAVLRLPNLGTYSSHLDLTHRFLADLALWRRILNGYFDVVDVVPVGTKYRDSPSLVRANWVLVNLLKWYELAQGWDFVCRKPKAAPTIEYVAWWEE